MPRSLFSTLLRLTVTFLPVTNHIVVAATTIPKPEADSCSSYTNTDTTIYLTRITNACVLLELGPYSILTDPWFAENAWGFREGPGITTADLPRNLTAVLGSHWAGDHWGIDALSDYPNREEIPVFTATHNMARKAQRAGFTMARKVSWTEEITIVPNELSLEVVEAQKFFFGLMETNNYIVSYSSPDAGDETSTTTTTRIFYGGEVLELEPIRQYHGLPVDVVLAPSNGFTLMGAQLVTTAAEAVEVARLLNASQLIPIHDSMHHMGFGWVTSSAKDLVGIETSPIDVLLLEAGKRHNLVL